MRIKSIRIQNYKSIKNVEMNNLGNLAAFIGPNMAGKSNLFEALCFLKNSSKIKLQDTLKNYGGFSEIAWRKDANPSLAISFELAIEIGSRLRDELLLPYVDEREHPNQIRLYDSPFLRNLVYKLSLNLGSTSHTYSEMLGTENMEGVDRRVIILGKQMVSDSGQISVNVNNIEGQLPSVLQGGHFSNNLNGYGSPYASDALQLSFVNEISHPIKNLDMKIANIFHNFIVRIKWLGPYRNIRDIATTTGNTILDPDAGNLVELINTARSGDSIRFNNLLQPLVDIIPELDEMLTPVFSGSTTVALHEKGQPAGVKYDLRHISAGTKNILSLLAFLTMIENDEVLFIEEPESHLHPRAIRKLMGVLQKYAQTHQILFTTHSSTTLTNLALGSIYLVKRNNQGDTDVSQVSSETIGEIIAELGIHLSDFLEHDLIVFVEGKYDVAVFEEFANKMDLQSRDICFISTDSWKNMDYHVNASILTKRTFRHQVIAVFDGDTEQNRHEKNRMLHRMRVPKENIFTLLENEIECYLLDVDAWLKTFSAAKLDENRLKGPFEKIRNSAKPKEEMQQFMEELGVGPYTAEVTRRLAKNMMAVPEEIKNIFDRAKVLIGNDKRSEAKVQ